MEESMGFEERNSALWEAVCFLKLSILLAAAVFVFTGYLTGGKETDDFFNRGYFNLILSLEKEQIL